MAPKDPVSQILGQRQREGQLRLATPYTDRDDGAPEPFVDPRQYVACKTSRRPPRLRIRCHDAPGRSPPYTALLDIVFNEQFPGIFSLLFHHQVVHVTGRNLGPVVDAINDHRAECISTYDPQAQDVPAEGGAVIEAVEFEGGNVMAQLEGKTMDT